MSRRLNGGAVVDVPAGGLAALAQDSDVDQLSSNSVVRSMMDVTNETIGSALLHSSDLGGPRSLTGKGIGVAVIDSGVADLPEIGKAVVASLDFTGTNTRDEFGHGTHVAGIIAARGVNAHDDTRGVAPGAHIISLKVIDGSGSGLVGNVIAALEWVVANKEKYNIQVANMSLGGTVLQSWRDDPLCQAVESAHRAGISVVASAGNRGKHGITRPGNCPFAITVGALNTKGTPTRSDDVMATYSS